MENKTHNFFLSKEEPNKSCLLALREIILEQNEGISESIKWGSPCYSFKNKMLCFLMVDKKSDHPYLLMVKGNELDFEALQQGTRKKMKVLPIHPEKDIPIRLLEEIIQSALSLY
ncbi:DUF1801 domain-containing protein [Brumimicrobium aurantiacum]|uniref:DUF1801 domain-containing protein n=1 Tax=Brumimicrobium aurantiacum TaxID=1737063 RepID=A0A3E1F224_9FLAO|nr:DUF1801 domain-containing protein [Brumimicrobium aurantiacum]RFC55845.1 DUF1801 domain-containing protein [Brumimicrobium aurantiacum]